jgi:hypothetical protein
MSHTFTDDHWLMIALDCDDANALENAKRVHASVEKTLTTTSRPDEKSKDAKPICKHCSQRNTRLGGLLRSHLERGAFMHLIGFSGLFLAYYLFLQMILAKTLKPSLDGRKSP